ncbi:prenyltransferase/squalene oxidase repeat-containing protein [Tundrisphaera sp. TA3]|uniref:prenyltransferase/squalene oxidase repeat-containing protein n=1 Tax=Tundrisphaera sp. TA3 TaxID=3435775 RepID=UPI003EB87AC0
MTTRLARMARSAALLLVLASPPSSARAQGPSPSRSDAAIAKALAYLQRSQKADGGWDAGFGRATSTTSLAVMAFLAAGHVPGRPGPYRDAIDRGIDYVLDHQKPNGMLVSNTSHGPMYCHGISTLMLAEVVGMIPDPEAADRARAALAKAVALILKAQDAPGKGERNAGGWRYQPTSSDSDLSVSGWQVMALRAAKTAGCAVPSGHIDRAVGYLKKCAAPGGGFGYQPGGGANNPRTGTGILALEICGDHLSAEAMAGAEYLLKHPPRWGSEYFFYEVYYCPQALFQVGDRYFDAYYPPLVAILLSHQDPDGSWLSGDGNDRSGGRVYCTATAVLALAVEYRYLPIYQR